MPKIKIPFKRRIKAQVGCFDDDSSFYNMFTGGLGSGKTAVLLFKGLKLSALNKDIAGGLLVPSLPEFKRDFLPMALELMNEIPGARYFSSGRFGIHFKFPWTRAPLYVMTAERQIKGPNLGWGLINEFSSIEWVRIWEFIARVRVQNTACRQIVMAGTPEDEHLWLEKFVEDNTKSGKLTVRESTTMENPFNDPKYAQDLLDNLDEDAAQVFVYGKMVRLGHDYFFYAYKPSVNDYPVEYDENALVHACVDFNVGKMSASFAHVYGEGAKKQACWFDEVRVTGIDADTEALGRAIIARYGTANVLVTCDASGKARKTSGLSDVKILQNMGLKVRYKVSNPRIRKSQIVMNGLLAKRKILINPVKCPLLKRDYLKVEQRQDFEQDKSKPDLTHMSDGSRYLCDFEFADFLDKDLRARYRVEGM